jgi:hypothetical protein
LYPYGTEIKPRLLYGDNRRSIEYREREQSQYEQDQPDHPSYFADRQGYAKAVKRSNRLLTESYESSKNLKALLAKVRKDYNLDKRPRYPKPKPNGGPLRDIHPYQTFTSTEPSIQIKQIKPTRDDHLLLRSSLVADKSRNISKAPSEITQGTLSTLIAINEAKIEEPPVVRPHKRLLQSEPPD